MICFLYNFVSKFIVLIILCILLNIENWYSMGGIFLLIMFVKYINVNCYIKNNIFIIYIIINFIYKLFFCFKLRN